MFTVDFLESSRDEVPVKLKSKRSTPTKYTLYPVSPKALRRGPAPRNAIVEIVGEDVGRPGQVFVRWVGWNYWVWVALKHDPDYVVKRGWKGSTKVIAEPYHRRF